MSGKFTEDHVEQACLDWLEALGYGVLHGPDISPDGDAPERAAYDVTILNRTFQNSLSYHQSTSKLPMPVTTPFVNYNKLISQV